MDSDISIKHTNWVVGAVLEAKNRPKMKENEPKSVKINCSSILSFFHWNLIVLHVFIQLSDINPENDRNTLHYWTIGYKYGQKGQK